MKIKYLNELKDLLVAKNVKVSDINQIVSDYKELYEQGLEQGLTDEDIVNKLGSPRFVYTSLKDDLSYKSYQQDRPNNDWITGIVVFLAVILFMLSGLVFNMWQYGWLFFLLIPISGILNNSNKKEVLPGISVFIALIIYFILGFTFNLWHPGWLIFTIIPIAGILTTTKTKDKLMGIVVFSTIVIYFLISFLYNDFYLYGWPIFLFIPLIATMYIENKNIRAGAIVTLLISMILYYIISLYFNNWGYPLLVFIVPLTFAIITNQIEFDGFGLSGKIGVILGILVAIIYVLVSITTKAWHLTWLILLFIPMIGIFQTVGFKHLVAYMPFLAVMIFFLVGFNFEDGFSYSWMAFFLIPITGILENKMSENLKDDDDEIELIDLEK